MTATEGWIVAAGLVLVIEGLLWGLAPGAAIRMLTEAAKMPELKLRMAGLTSVALGVALVWIVRG